MNRPADPDYVFLLTDTKDVRCHTQHAFMRYLDIATVSQRFGMAELEIWARAQLALLLQSPERLVDGPWDKDALLQAGLYANATGNPDLVRQTTALVQLIVSLSVQPFAMAQAPSSSNIDSCVNACVQLCKDPALRASNPALFGFVFTAILSLGHHSTI